MSRKFYDLLKEVGFPWSHLGHTDPPSRHSLHCCTRPHSGGTHHYHDHCHRHRHHLHHMFTHCAQNTHSCYRQASNSHLRTLATSGCRSTATCHRTFGRLDHGTCQLAGQNTPIFYSLTRWEQIYNLKLSKMLLEIMMVLGGPKILSFGLQLWWEPVYTKSYHCWLLNIELWWFQLIGEGIYFWSKANDHTPWSQRWVHRFPVGGMILENCSKFLGVIHKLRFHFWGSW